MLKGIHHAAIICSNYEKSKFFYVSILGLEIAAENYRKTRGSYKLDLKLPDGSQIEIFSLPDRPVRPSYPEARGLRHLAFSVSSIETTVDHQGSSGIDIESIRIDEYTGKQYTFLRIQMTSHWNRMSHKHGTLLGFYHADALKHYNNQLQRDQKHSCLVMNNNYQIIVALTAETC